MMPKIIGNDIEKRHEKKLRRSLWCRRAAYFYLVILCIGLPFGIFCIATSVWAPNVPETPEPEQISSDRRLENKWTTPDSAFILLLTMSTVNIHVVVKLMNASNAGGHSADVFALTQIWRQVNLAFFGLAIMELLLTTTEFTSGAKLLIPTLLLVIVWHYKKELKAIKAKSHFPLNKDASVEKENP